jgi:hypothetical protein
MGQKNGVLMRAPAKGNCSGGGVADLVELEEAGSWARRVDDDGIVMVTLGVALGVLPVAVWFTTRGALQ